MIKISKTASGEYIAYVTPYDQPAEPWRAGPLSADALIDTLRDKGCHTTDITDALYEADPDWLTRSENPEG